MRERERESERGRSNKRERRIDRQIGRQRETAIKQKGSKEGEITS